MSISVWWTVPLHSFLYTLLSKFQQGVGVGQKENFHNMISFFPFFSLDTTLKFKWWHSQILSRDNGTVVYVLKVHLLKVTYPDYFNIVRLKETIS